MQEKETEGRVDEYRIGGMQPGLFPLRLRGVYTYREAYFLACDWNMKHPVEQAAWPERLKEHV